MGELTQWNVTHDTYDIFKQWDYTLLIKYIDYKISGKCILLKSKLWQDSIYIWNLYVYLLCVGAC